MGRACSSRRSAAARSTGPAGLLRSLRLAVSTPATFADLGGVVRVSTALECGCVFESAARGDDGEPLLEPSLRVAGDLPGGLTVRTIPDQVPIGAGATAARAAVVAWTDAVLAQPDEGCVVGRACGLARRARGGRADGASRSAGRAVDGPRSQPSSPSPWRACRTSRDGLATPPMRGGASATAPASSVAPSRRPRTRRRAGAPRRRCNPPRQRSPRPSASPCARRSSACTWSRPVSARTASPLRCVTSAPACSLLASCRCPGRGRSGTRSRW
jgi:hypothetical protein